MKRYLRLLSLLGMIFLLASCQGRKESRIISPEQHSPLEEWRPEERSMDIVIHTLKTTQEASYHLIRLNSFEKPHTHDEHDLVVFVLKGKSQFVMGQKSIEVKAGDVIEIPRGIVHWAKNLDPEATEVYAVFTPPFDGKDHHIVPEVPVPAA